jgi:hypothetical protein
MTDRTNSDFAALLTPPPSRGVQFSQAKVLTWDNELLENSLEWRGITIRNIPMVEGINALTIRAGDVVGMLGWAPENAKGAGSWWILGKLSNPGEFVADLNVTAKVFRFVTEQGYALGFFGKEADGEPTWILYYGDAGEQPAIRVTNSEFLSAFDFQGNEVFGTDGATQVGLSRPYLNIPMVPSSGTSVGTGGPFWPQFTNVNYQEVLHGFTTLWHPRISIGVATNTPSGTVEWELRIDGTTIGSGSGSGSDTFAIPGWGTTIIPGSTTRSVQLFCRNTSGVASRVIVDRCYGLQS